MKVNCVESCEPIYDSVSGFNLTLWRNTTFISENYTYNYLTLLKNAKLHGVQCDKGYKQCGLLNSFNQILCLLESETCPLNQIEFSNSSTPSDIFTNKSAVTTTLLNDNETYLHTSNAEINSPVITDIVLGPELFCFDSKERKLGPPYYEYERSSTNNKCTEYAGNEIDYHYISIDNQTKLTVYNENEIITKIQDFLTYSEEPYPQNKLNDYKLHLYKRNYVGFNLTCLGEQVLNEETSKYLYKYFYSYDLLHIFAVLFFIWDVMGF